MLIMWLTLSIINAVSPQDLLDLVADFDLGVVTDELSGSSPCPDLILKSVDELLIINLYPLTIPQPQLIHVYCDNAGIIARINGSQATLQPRDTLHDDYPIFTEINCQVQLLYPYQFDFYHVKGHQDQKKNQPLSIQEWLNIDCDAHASGMPPPPSNMDLSHHLQLTAGYPHFGFGTSVVTQKVQHTLCDAAT